MTDLETVRAARDRGETQAETVVGSWRQKWTPELGVFCRHCGKRDDVWRTDGDDYYHGAEGICLNCGHHDCCLPLADSSPDKTTDTQDSAL